MAGKKKNYFVRANSSQGLVNLIYSNVVGLRTGIILVGEFEILKQEVLAAISRYLTDSDIDCECIHSCYEPDALEGIIIRSKGIGIFSDKVLNPTTIQLFVQSYYVDLDLAIDETFGEIRCYMEEDQDKCGKKYEEAYEDFSQAILIHDEWEKIYISHMHFDKANDYTKDIIDDLFKDAAGSENTSQTRHRFFGGATYQGSVDYVMDLTKNMGSRFFIKGRPGSGKSTMLRKIQEKAEDLGYDVEVYHCGFDPNSLDMVLVEDLDFCIFDSTAPHEYFPSTSHDYILDMYAVSIDAGTDEKYQGQLDEIITAYKAKIAHGTDLMKEGKAYIDHINHELNHYVKDYLLAEKILIVQQYINK